MVTSVPPAVGPEPGRTLVITGAAMKVKAAVSLTLWPAGFVTTMSTVPALWGGATATMWVGFVMFTSVEFVNPKLTLVAV